MGGRILLEVFCNLEVFCKEADNVKCYELAGSKLVLAGGGADK